MGQPKLPQLDVLYQAGINPKTGLPLKYGNVKCQTKEDIKKANQKLNTEIIRINSQLSKEYNCLTACLQEFETIKKELEILAKSGAITIKFVDRTFNAKADRANEILEFILSNYGTKIPEGTCFHFEIAGDILKEGTMEILSKAQKGVFQLEIGMQSFNEDTLKAINRKTNTSILKKNIQKVCLLLRSWLKKLIWRNGIHIQSRLRMESLFV